MKQYTYNAPLEIYDTSPTTTKSIVANYLGLPLIWISVDKSTNKIINFVSDGELPQPDEKDNIRYQLLSQENPNHIIAMDMLYGCKGQINTDSTDELIHTFTNGFEIRYSRPQDPDAIHTFDMQNLVINQQGVITYNWCPPFVNDQDFRNNILISIEEANKALQTLGPAGSIAQKAKYQKLIEVLVWVRDNTQNVPVWKINLPTVETFS